MLDKNTWNRITVFKNELWLLLKYCYLQTIQMINGK